MNFQRLWDKGIAPHPAVIEFTTGNEKQTDLQLAGWDIAGSLAHVIMLAKAGLITDDEKKELMKALHSLFEKHLKGEFVIEDGVEDIHSQVEKELSDMIGPAGRKVHTGRSRNDQVLLDIRLFTRAAIDNLAGTTHNLFNRLISLSNQYSEVLMPGYTHMQPAMVSSFGLWFGGYAEALADDLLLLSAAGKINNRNPLGTAAGYGTTLPVDRSMTTALLGFEDMIYNSVYSGINRGKVESAVASALASLGNTLAKFSMDICLFMTTEFRFIEFPDDLITGSSIMPQKKNPDVFEIVRAKCNLIQSLPAQVSMIINNLPSGYNRDLQLLKQLIFNGFNEIIPCVEILTFMLGEIKIRRNILDNPQYNSIFSTEEVNRMVRNGIPFRDAYMAVSGILKDGSFLRTMTSDYTHEGSIGNLCNDRIAARESEIMRSFNSIPAKELVERLMTYL
ncbi:MAG: argininosuccinate lyase [Bacteroidales bacterium]|nr:argininosuccinate lyase [Bacteroidales bacterium]